MFRCRVREEGKNTRWRISHKKKDRKFCCKITGQKKDRPHMRSKNGYSQAYMYVTL